MNQEIRKIIEKEVKVRDSVIRLQLFMFLFIIIIFLGVVSNQAVVKFNGNRMPVLSNFDLSDETHFSYQNPQEIILSPLTDRFNALGYIWSIGDMLMVGGFILLIFNTFFLIQNLRKLQIIKREWKEKKWEY